MFGLVLFFISSNNGAAHIETYLLNKRKDLPMLFDRRGLKILREAGVSRLRRNISRVENHEYTLDKQIMLDLPQT